MMPMMIFIFIKHKPQLLPFRLKIWTKTRLARKLGI
jgi:hypothetical protein